MLYLWPAQALHVPFAGLGRGAGGTARRRVVGLPTGHWVMRQRPQEFNAALIDWLDGR